MNREVIRSWRMGIGVIMRRAYLCDRGLMEGRRTDHRLMVMNRPASRSSDDRSCVPLNLKRLPDRSPLRRMSGISTSKLRNFCPSGLMPFLQCDVDAASREVFRNQAPAETAASTLGALNAAVQCSRIVGLSSKISLSLHLSDFSP
jgi:hypothetical protein